jgi:hypothetical protein
VVVCACATATVIIQISTISTVNSQRGVAFGPTPQTIGCVCALTVLAPAFMVCVAAHSATPTSRANRRHLQHPTVAAQSNGSTSHKSTRTRRSTARISDTLSSSGPGRAGPLAHRTRGRRRIEANRGRRNETRACRWEALRRLHARIPRTCRRARASGL